MKVLKEKVIKETVTVVYDYTEEDGMKHSGMTEEYPNREAALKAIKNMSIDPNYSHIQIEDEITEANEEQNMLDVNQFIGKPLKDLLAKIGKARVSIKYKTKSFYGNDGLFGRAFDVSWDVADRKIISVSNEPNKYVDYDIVTE